MKLPAAVIFDMDGVLADTEPLHAQCYCEVFTGMGLALTTEEYRRHVTMGHKDVRDVFTMIGGNMDLWPDVMEKKTVRITQLFEENCVLRPGVLDLLKSLKADNIPTAIATSAGRRTLSILMDIFKIEHYFDDFVTWQDVSATKPDPEAFLIAAKKLGAKPEHCVVIEDSPRGVLAAHRAGMKCIAVPTASTAEANFSLATSVVKSLQEVTLQTLHGFFSA